MPSRNPVVVLAPILVAMAIAWPAPGIAQSLPPYASMNPMVTRRTGLSTLPWIEPGRPWRVTWVNDYANSLEYVDTPAVTYIQDAELLRVDVTVTRSLAARGFLIAAMSLEGAYDGFLDGFLDWYHDLLGLNLPARELRPRNQFGYQLVSSGESATYESSGAFLGDLRLGAGLRLSPHFQAALIMTLPTSTGPEGFRRGVVSVNATSTLRAAFGRRGAFVYEGTLGAGYTPAHGDFKPLQQTLFLMISQGLRARIVGPLHLYTNVIYHSALYHDTGTRSLDSRELTIDVGGLLRFGRGPEWILGLTEDLEPSGPAIDVAFRIGVRW